jgi:hypothetical protein
MRNHVEYLHRPLTREVVPCRDPVVARLNRQASFALRIGDWIFESSAVTTYAGQFYISPYSVAAMDFPPPVDVFLTGLWSMGKAHRKLAKAGYGGASIFTTPITAFTVAGGSEWLILARNGKTIEVAFRFAHWPSRSEIEAAHAKIIAIIQELDAQTAIIN